MNKFATLAVFICAYLTIGSCHGGLYGNNYGRVVKDNGAAAASSSAAIAGGINRPVEIIAAAPRYAHGHEVLRPIRLEGAYGARPVAPYVARPVAPYVARPVAQYAAPAPYEPRAAYGHQHRGGYGRPRWSVQPAGATLLYPGQNNYRAYVSPVEYSKVVLPIRPAAPVAKLYIPENKYASPAGYGVQGPSY